MPEYDFGRMQAEAVRRAREMQSRARVSEPAPPPKPPEEPTPPSPPPTLPQPQEEPHSLMDSLFADKERTIILALLVLLSGEQGNHELLFALLFLLL